MLAVLEGRVGDEREAQAIRRRGGGASFNKAMEDKRRQNAINDDKSSVRISEGYGVYGVGVQILKFRVEGNGASGRWQVVVL